MKKRFLCLLFALFLFVSLIPATVLADEATEKPEVKFDFMLSGQDERIPPVDGKTDTEALPAVMLDEDVALTMKAGDEPVYYATTQSTNPTFPNNFYLSPGSAAEWNVKFEYPADGIPTVTLKDAKIINKFGLWFGGVNIPMTSDIKIVLEGTNRFEYLTPNEDSTFPKRGLFNMNTTGTVTITGSGKLDIYSDSHSTQTGAIMGRGDIILDHVDIFMSMPETKGKSNGIQTTGGDIIMKGGSWTIDSYDDPKTLHAVGQESGYRNNQEAIHSAVFAKKRADGTGGNFVVEDGAKVLIMASPFVNDYNKGVLMYTEGKFTIKNSTVEIGLVGKVPTGVSIFAEKPTFEFTNDTYYIVAIKTKKADYTPGTLALTPDLTRAVDWFNHERMAQLTYFKVTPGGEGGPTCAMPPVEEEEEWTPPVEDNTGNTGNTGNNDNTGNTGNTGNNDNTGNTDNTPEPSQPAPTQPAQPAPTEGTKDPAEVVTPNATEQKAEDNQDGEGSGNGLLILVIVLCVLAVGGSGFAVYWFVLRKPKK